MTDKSTACWRLRILVARDAAGARRHRCARRSARPPRRCSSPSRFVYASAEQAEARFKDEDPGFIYSRFSNPTVAMFEERMRLLEGAEAARATATGMAAVTSALLCFLKAGDHIVAARAMFGSCLYVAQELCPRFGIACTLVDGRDTAAWQRAVQPNTKAFFFETPANPTLDLVDIAAVSRDRARAPARWSSSTTCSPRPCCRSR